MAQSQTQTQEQLQQQLQRLSPQQRQLVELLEMSIAEFEDCVKKELKENPVLEEGRYGGEDEDDGNTSVSADEMEKNDTGEDPNGDDIEEMRSELEKYDDDDLPVHGVNNGSEERNELPLGDSGSFIEYLESQIINYDLDETQQAVLEYLIGMLDNRGFIDASNYTITENLAFKENIYVEESDVEEMISVLQSFDPAGIGARDTRECLLLQIDRQLNNDDEPISEAKEKLLMLQRKVVADHFDLFLNRNKEGLKGKLHVSDAAVEMIFASLKKLNINPGLSLGEASSSRAQTIIPDFIVETDTEGNIDIKLNNGEIPRIHVRPEYVQQLKFYLANPNKMREKEKEAMLFTKQKVEAAQMYIDNIKQRRRTLYEVMHAIVELQRPYFLSQDENDKARMVMKDVATKSGHDISTVSRVCNSKYASVNGRIFQLSEFFKLTRKNAEGDEVDGGKVEEALRALVDREDKRAPYSDDRLAELLTKQGIKIARRTVAKYRKTAGIPQMADRKA